MTDVDTSHKNELELARLEGTIKEGFAKLSGEIKLHTREMQDIARNVQKVTDEVKEVSKSLEEHVISKSPHAQCDHNIQDINQAHDIIREVRDVEIPAIEKRIRQMEDAEKLQKGQISGIKWVMGSGILAAVVMGVLKFVGWILQK